jgi:hypothetical protein
MRDASTYRGARRNGWRDAEVRRPWLMSNADYRGYGWDIGGRKTNRRGLATMTGFLPTVARSKYLPHESVKRGGSGPVFA